MSSAIVPIAAFAVFLAIYAFRVRRSSNSVTMGAIRDYADNTTVPRRMRIVFGIGSFVAVVIIMLLSTADWWVRGLVVIVAGAVILGQQVLLKGMFGSDDE